MKKDRELGKLALMAADRIREPALWCRGQLGDPLGRGRVCLVGALMTVDESSDTRSPAPATRKLNFEIRRRTKTHEVARFNDRSKHRDVLNLLLEIGQDNL